LIKAFNLDKVDITGLLSDKLVQMEEFKAWAKKSIILFMKANSKMISIMDTVDIFIQMEIIISVIGKMERDKDGVN